MVKPTIIPKRKEIKKACESDKNINLIRFRIHFLSKCEQFSTVGQVDDAVCNTPFHTHCTLYNKPHGNIRAHCTYTDIHRQSWHSPAVHF